ncbi:AAA family ATPase [Erwinia tracheiphila]
MTRRAGQLGRAIRRKLRGTQGLLIIDEADHLDYPVLEELRILQEETGIGLALVGNHQVYARLTGGSSRSVDFARLFSRIAKKSGHPEDKNGMTSRRLPMPGD